MKKLTALLPLLLAAFISCAGAQKPVVLGDERLDVYLPLLGNNRVAIFSNQSGIVGDKAEGLKVPAGRTVDDAGSLVPFGTPADPAVPVKYGPHLLDVLLGKGVNVTAIFSPEHGFRGTADAGEHVSSSVDEPTGVPILSLYGSGSHTPSAESMSKFDVLVVDIQDVGLRYYTYYVTMLRLMDACAKYDKQVVILDRPNPNGFYVDGPLLDMKYKSGIGGLPIAMVHGMTLGELALMINGEGWLTDGAKCRLTVVPCLNYTHSTKYTILLPPSPNLKDMKSVYLYASTCFFEGTVVTTGRGTEFPFETYGHPDMPDCNFTFTPRSIPGARSPRFMDQECHGVDLRGKPVKKIWAEGATLEYVIDAYRKMNMGAEFFGTNNHFELLVGQGYVRDMILAGASADEIKAKWKDDVKAFKKARRPYLLYAE